MHITKKSITFAPLLRKDRNVAQLVAHYVRDVGVGRSSRLIPTRERKLIQVSFRLFFWITERPTPVRCGELKQGFRVKRGRSSRLIPTKKGSQIGSLFLFCHLFEGFTKDVVAGVAGYSTLVLTPKEWPIIKVLKVVGLAEQQSGSHVTRYE